MRSIYGDSRMTPYVLVALCVLSLTSGQLMFKIVSGHITDLRDLAADLPTLGLLVTALSLYAVSTLAWIVALQSLPLSRAYMFLAFSFILVPIAAHFVLGEPLGLRLVFGAALILVGIWAANT